MAQGSVVLKFDGNIVVTNRRWLVYNNTMNKFLDENMKTLVINDGTFEDYSNIYLKHIECLSLVGKVNAKGFDVLMKCLPNLKKVKFCELGFFKKDFMNRLFKCISNESFRVEEIVFEGTIYDYDLKELKSATVTKITYLKKHEREHRIQPFLEPLLLRNEQMQEKVTSVRRICVLILLNTKLGFIIPKDVVCYVLKLVYQPKYRWKFWDPNR